MILCNIEEQSRSRLRLMRDLCSKSNEFVFHSSIKIQEQGETRDHLDDNDIEIACLREHVKKKDLHIFTKM